MSAKPKIAMYWAASCGGCEIAFLSINERILELIQVADLVFCPCIMDVKTHDIEAMPDGHIDVVFFNGGIRTSENEYMAELLRRKAKFFVGFGSCAQEGCIPGLANAVSAKSIFDEVYRDSPTVENPDDIRPEPHCVVDGCELHLPVFYDRLRTVGQIVDVDAYLPGCPPEADRIWEAIQALLSGASIPKGAVIGSKTTVCHECGRTRSEKRIKKIYRTYEMIPNPTQCLLEQGLICAGIATRAGCGALCPTVNSPCIGCYGPVDGVSDFGAQMLGAIASVIDADDPAEIDRIIEDGIPDPIGTFYKFTLASSALRGAACPAPKETQG